MTIHFDYDFNYSLEPSVNGKAPKAFGDLQVSNEQFILGDGETTPLEDSEVEDMKDFAFEKFATMYFQGQVSATYQTRALQKAILIHVDNTDNMVCLLSPDQR